MSLTNKLSTTLRVVVVMTLLTVVAGKAGPAQAQPCLKYNNQLPFCAVGQGQLADPAWCDGSSLLPISPQDETVLYSRLLADDPDEAMDEWGKYGYPDKYANQEDMDVGPLTWAFTEDMSDDPDNIDVWFDTDLDGKQNDGAPADVLMFGSLTREPCCEIVVKGPHELMPDVWYDQPNGPKTMPINANPPADGLEFTKFPARDTTGNIVQDSQVWAIRLPNRLKNERWYFASDLFREGAEKLRKFETDALGDQFDGALDNTPFDYGTTDKRDDAPQVDHIVPRVDKYGCPCGSNSSKNAHVISAKLNRQMSNNCSDPRRIEIIKHYAVVPAPSASEVSMPTGEWVALVASSIRLLADEAQKLMAEVFDG